VKAQENEAALSLLPAALDAIQAGAPLVRE